MKERTQESKEKKNKRIQKTREEINEVLILKLAEKGTINIIYIYITVKVNYVLFLH